MWWASRCRPSQKLDAENRVAVVRVNGQERMVSIAGDVALLEEDGRALTGGLLSPELAPGGRMALTVERVGNMPTILGIRLGRMATPRAAAQGAELGTLGSRDQSLPFRLGAGQAASWLGDASRAANLFA